MKKGLQLLTKILIALIPLWAICIYTALFPLSYLSGDSVGAYWNRKFTNSKQEKQYDVVILGDSMGATSYMPELLSDSTINLSLSGSSVVEGYYTLEDFLENNNAPTDVFVSYMDYHLAKNDFTLDTCNQVHKFSFKQYAEIYKTMHDVGADTFEEMSVDDYWEKALVSKLYMPSEYIASIFNSIKEGGRSKANQATYDNITIHGGRYCKMINDITESDGIAYSEFSVSPLQSAYYVKLVELCKSKDIKLHFVKLPLSNYTYFSDEYIAQVNGYYNILTSSYTNSEFLWYPADYVKEWFWDDYHMNQHGSYRFSMQLKEQFPDLFGDYSATADQMLAINNDLDIENEPSELFKWIDNKDYIVCLYDGMHMGSDFEGIYNAFLKNSTQYLTALNDDLYYVEGDTNDTKVEAATDGTNLSVKVGGVTYTTYVKDFEGAIGFVVIDNKNNQLVLSKTSMIDYESFSLSKLQ